MPDWGDIQAKASGDTYRWLFLSPQTFWMVTAALTVIDTRRGWGRPDNSTWDEIEAALALAYLETGKNGMIGTIIWVGTAAVPDNCLVCDGGSYLRVDYPELYAVLDSAFVDDADHFHTPDMRDRFIIGAGSTYSPGDTGGEATHTLTESEMPSHTHGYTVPIPNIDVEAPGVPDVTAAGVGPVTSTGGAGGGAAHNNLPPYLGLLPCLIAR